MSPSSALPRRVLAPLALLALSLAACTPSSGSAMARPAATRITLVAMGPGAQAVLPQVQAGLAETFPGMPVTVAPAEPIPEGVQGEHGAVSAEKLMARMEPRGPGVLVLLDADLGSQVFSSVFSQVDFPHGNAVVALAHFATADGTLPRPGTPLPAEAAARLAVRARRQAVNAVGKLLALFPCKEERCVLQRPSGVEALDKADGLCPRHAAMLEVKLRDLRQQATPAASR